MTTVHDLIRTTRRRYLLGGNEMRNKLTAPYTAGQGQLSFAYDLKGIQAGNLLSIGLNTFYVWSADGASKTAVVSGGENGSVDANADAGDTVWVSSRFSDLDVLNAMNEELLSLSAPAVGLYQPKTVEFAFSSTRDGFDLPGVTDLISIIEVRYDLPDGRSTTPSLANGDYRLERSYTTAENPSTYSLKMFRGGYQGRNVTVVYRAPFTKFTSLEQDATACGMPEHALDIPPMGAALRLLLGREIRRNDPSVQGDTRRAEEVGPGAAAASFRPLAAARAERIAEEASILASAYPLSA